MSYEKWRLSPSPEKRAAVRAEVCARDNPVVLHRLDHPHVQPLHSVLTQRQAHGPPVDAATIVPLNPQVVNTLAEHPADQEVTHHGEFCALNVELEGNVFMRQRSQISHSV
eukprot:CAMPEP_0183341798 /NCGR_PEP_ID=MMETSP0164_2-20130417/8015_1 /TAXON_ID=221442 /ORGANISM="Coccolithus pelagicus ssp braarudi, Strain PLY182g" /LENGTH=110 /DNA_ID=CAMNT_0025512215 /DNA_START=211 /DNA_END=543 /DNA_ORIENTATION=-